MTNFDRVSAWHAKIGNKPGDANITSVAIGVMIEEFAEFLHAIDVGPDINMLHLLIADLESFGVELKTRNAFAVIQKAKRVDALDALCDIDVTANGVAYLAGFSKNEADEEVLRSNESKFDEDGNPVILPGGKVGKGKLYSPPNLAPFV